MLEDLKDELYQLENKQAKGAKLHPNIRQELESEKYSEHFFKVLEIQNMHNQTKFELYTKDNKSKYFSNPKDILRSAKKLSKTLHQANLHSCYY